MPIKKERMSPCQLSLCKKYFANIADHVPGVNKRVGNWFPLRFNEEGEELKVMDIKELRMITRVHVWYFRNWTLDIFLTDLVTIYTRLYTDEIFDIYSFFSSTIKARKFEKHAGCWTWNLWVLDSLCELSLYISSLHFYSLTSIKRERTGPFQLSLCIKYFANFADYVPVVNTWSESWCSLLGNVARSFNIDSSSFSWSNIPCHWLLVPATCVVLYPPVQRSSVHTWLVTLWIKALQSED